MDPDTIGQVHVRAGHMQRDGGDTAVDPFDGRDHFLREVLTNQMIADAQQFRGAEPSLLVPANEERVLEGRLDAPVNKVEAIVLAEHDAGDGRAAG